MKCMYCQGEMKKSTVPFHIDRKGIHLSLDDVPAWVCRQCGEPYFEESEVDFLSALACQGAIAIENARLFEHIRSEYKDLARDVWKWYDWGERFPTL